MSRYERSGVRDLTFSRWHRYALGDHVTAIDVDLLEYCQRCRAPLCLIESARDVGQADKPTTVLAALSAVTGIPALCVLYTPGPRPCRCDEDYRAPGCRHGISGFRVREVGPGAGPLKHWETWELAAHLATIHDSSHEMACSARAYR
jgi:hypothetical protein